MVACSLLILYLLITVLYVSGSLKRQFLNREYDSLDHTLESLNVLFSTIEDYSIAIMSDDTVQNILAYPKLDRSSDTITMRKQISRYLLTNPYFDAAVLYAVNGRSYDSGAIIMLDGSWEKGYEAQQATWLSLHDAPYIGSSVIRSRHVFSLIRPVYNYQNASKIGVIEIFIAESTIADAFLTSRNQRLFYLVDGNNTIIAHPDKSLLLTKDAVPLQENDAVYGASGYYTISRRYDHIGWYLKSATPVSVIYAPIYRMLLTLTVFGLLLICLGIAFSGKAAKTITRDISRLTESVRKIVGFGERLPPLRTSEEISVLCTEFNNMLSKLELASTQIVQEHFQKRKFQLELLQQQLNPHFLYNILENISSLAELGYRNELLELIDNVGCFYRGVLSGGNILIPLSSELEVARSYLQILKIRTHSQFSHTFDIDPDLMNNICIKLILQPLLENSVYHGFSGMNRTGCIRVEAKAVEDGILLIVSDNGKGMNGKTMANLLREMKEGDCKNKGYALANIRQRINLYFGEGYGLEITGGENAGTTVTLKLPRQDWRKE